MAESRSLIEPADRAELRSWLERNHADSPSIWLVVHKKGASSAALTYEQAVEEALCFGWIDGQARTLDDRRFIILLARRKAGSGWAASNKTRVERLLAKGLMRPAGIAAVEAAKADGSWALLDSVEALEVPEDLARALAESPPARANFEMLAPSVRKMTLYWVIQAKRPETRARRIALAVEAAREGRAARM